MAVYEKVKCPHCNATLKFYELKTSHGKFGTPIIRCWSCNGLINTGKKLWCNIKLFDKIMFIFSMIMATLTISIVAPILYGIILLFIDEELINLNVKWFIIIYLSTFILFFIRQIKTLKENIKLIEDDFHKKKFELNDY